MLTTLLARSAVRRRVLFVAAVAIALVTAGGAWRTLSQGPSVLDLDGEANVPALASGLLLGFAALAAGLAARRRPDARLALLCLAGLLAFMALDEVALVHERLERKTGVDWQLLYLPVVLAGAVGYLRVVLLAHRIRAGRDALLLGAAAWVLAQALERLEWGGGAQTAAEVQARQAMPGYQVMMVFEEVAEMAGSLALALGLLGLLAAALPRGQHPVAVDAVALDHEAVRGQERAEPHGVGDELVGARTP